MKEIDKSEIMQKRFNMPINKVNYDHFMTRITLFSKLNHMPILEIIRLRCFSSRQLISARQLLEVNFNEESSKVEDNKNPI